jgi:molybdenum cofactor cytidylyltransferase
MPPDRSSPVAGIVLAAGTSTRMGRNKLFFELEGETILRRAVGTAAAAGLDPVLVVLGHEADRARGELTGLPCQPVLNPDYARGQSSSLRTGIAAVPARSAAAVVTLADMPFVTATMIATAIDRYRERGALLVVSDYGGVSAPPTLYDRSLFAEILALDGGECGRHVVKRHRAETLAVAWPAAALADLDVPDDYERAKTLLRMP